MPKQICGKCHRTLEPKKNGVSLVQLTGPKTAQPYALWSGDLLACPVCGIEVIVTAQAPSMTQSKSPDIIDGWAEDAVKKGAVRFY